MASLVKSSVALRCAFCHRLITELEMDHESRTGEEESDGERVSESLEQLWLSGEDELLNVEDLELSEAPNITEVDIEEVKR